MTKLNRSFFLNISIICLWSILFWQACSDSNLDSNGTPVVSYAEEADFAADSSQATIQLAEGFTLDLWAPGPLVSNAVALSFDNQGVAYVSETSRRKSSDLDIRQHRDWMTQDLQLQSIEDTRAFHKKVLDPSLSDQNTWMEDFNQDSVRDWRDLEVQSEYIRRIWDSDGDGRADASSLFAEDFNGMLTGVAAGVLHYDDAVFLTAAPEVWRLEDLDGDGDADQRAVISEGYGIHIAFAGHDMSGLTMGPDGRVYWSIGDIGVNVVDQNGKRWAYPNQGAVMRANPDGSDFEVFAHGLRNPQELAFDAYGNLISVDNDGDHSGEHERYVHIIEGSDSGWRINWQYGKYNRPNESYKIWMDERLHVPHFPGQAAYLLPPIALAPNGPAGLAYNPGTALDSKWNNFFFGSYFKGSAAKSKLEAFQLKPKGASFEVSKEIDIINGIASTGITFGPDGALYINDWKDGYAKKPKGRIWRLDTGNQEAKAQKEKTARLLREGTKEKSISELLDQMAYPDMRIRMAAQFELVKRKKKAELLTIANTNSNEYARLHAIWGIGQLGRKNSQEVAALVPLLEDENKQIKAQVLKVMGEAKFENAFDQILSLLKDPAPEVQFFAAEALGKLGNRDAFQGLVDLLEQVGETDPHLRHAIVYALSKLENGTGKLHLLYRHASAAVRIGAVVALRQLRSVKVAAYLKDTNPLVLTEAARAIHDDASIIEALPALAQALSSATISNEAFLRRAINANLRVGSAECAKRLAAFANTPNANMAMRLDALWALGYWPEELVLDRVEGRYRDLPNRKTEDGQAALEMVVDDLLASNLDTMRAATFRAIGRLSYTQKEAIVFAALKNENNSNLVRTSALKALSELNSPNLLEALRLAVVDKAQSLREEAQTLLGEVNLPKEEVARLLGIALENGTPSEQQKALKSLAASGAQESEQILNTWIDRLAAQKIEPALQLDVLLAVEEAGFESGKAKLAAYEAEKNPEDAIAPYLETIYGGNPRKGARLFYQNSSAQCIRCHAYQGLGGAVGPELDGIAEILSPEELLTSLIDPSARLAPGYGTVTLKLKDGTALTGILMEEQQETLTLKIGGDTLKEVALKDIRSRENLPSGMLSMANILSKSEIRDLMAFLLTMQKGKELKLF